MKFKIRYAKNIFKVFSRYNFFITVPFLKERSANRAHFISFRLNQDISWFDEVPGLTEKQVNKKWLGGLKIYRFKRFIKFEKIIGRFFVVFKSNKQQGGLDEKTGCPGSGCSSG